MNDLHARLDSLAKLSLGWDGYMGLPVKKQVIEKAKDLLLSLPDFNWHAVPGSGGDLQIEMHEQGFDIEINIDCVRE